MSFNWDHKYSRLFPCGDAIYFPAKISEKPDEQPPARAKIKRKVAILFSVIRIKKTVMVDIIIPECSLSIDLSLSVEIQTFEQNECI